MTKKLLNLTKIALLIFSISFLLGSCTKEYTNDIYIDNPTKWEIVDFEVRSGDWKWDEKDECYFYSFDFPELTEFIANDGSVSVSTPIDGTFRPLAFTTYFYDEQTHYVSQTVSFEYSTKFIRFNVSRLDLFDSKNINTFNPERYIFKTTLIW